MLEAQSISKSFFGVTVLSDFSLAIKEGEVHALLGHNGSGKSTLIKILAGYYEPDPGSGSIAVDGHELRKGDGESSIEIGIRVVHQGLGLIPTLTVLDNLRMGPHTYSTSWGARIRWRDERARARTELRRVGLDHVSPEDLLGHLSPVEQTGIAIVRALHDTGGDLRFLILDEPTGVLPESEVDRLVGIIKELREQSIGVLYVTHRLEEVQRVADSVTVLRDGLTVGSGTIGEFPRSRLIQLIAGEVGTPGQVATPEHPEAVAEAVPSLPDRDERALRMIDITAHTLNGFSLSASPGEVVGVISLVGAGVGEIPKILRGDLAAEGQILLGDRPVTIKSPHQGQRLGITVVPAQMNEKIFEGMSVRENLTTGLLRRFWKSLRVNGRLERRFAREIVRDLSIRAPGLEADIKLLSGGNKQKVVMGRALQLRPLVLVVDEPTNGVDVAGTKDILGLLGTAARGGMTVIVCSSDIDDMVGGCSRVLVLGDGRVRLELTGDEISRERILTEVHANVS